MVETRRVRRRLSQDKEAEAPGGGGGGSTGAEASAAPTAVAVLGPAAAPASSSVPPPSPKPSSSSSHLSSASTATAVAAMARSRNDEQVQGEDGQGQPTGRDVTLVGSPNGTTTALTSTPLLSPRTHAFSSETWWMVDLEVDPPQGATRLVKTCMHAYGWDSRKARSVLRAYRQFLFLKTKYGDYDAKMFSPSRAVDMMWHQHILDVVNYIHDCALLCGGRVVGHDPRGSEQGPERAERRRATQKALLRHKGEIGIEEEEWKELFEGNESGSPATAATDPEPPAAAAAAPAPRAAAAAPVPPAAAAAEAPAPRAAAVVPAPRAAAAAPVPRAAAAPSPEEEEEESFILFVETTFGSRFTINVSPDDGRLSVMYDDIASKTGIPVHEFRLCAGGKWLRNNQSSPRDVGLKKGSTIILEKAIQVYVDTNGRGDIVFKKVWPISVRLSNLYKAVSSHLGMQSYDIRLLFMGARLRDDESLHAQGLVNNSIVQVAFAQTGC